MRDALTAALKDAMKAKDSLRLSTIRLIQSAIKDQDIAQRTAGKEPLSEAEILQLMAKLIKQREESAKIYEQNARPELAEKERLEIAAIAAFMPKQLSEEETRAAIEKTISETGAAGIKDMGKVIAALRAAYAGQMDFGKASGMVKAMLG